MSEAVNICDNKVGTNSSIYSPPSDAAHSCSEPKDEQTSVQDSDLCLKAGVENSGRCEQIIGHSHNVHDIKRLSTGQTDQIICTSCPIKTIEQPLIPIATVNLNQNLGNQQQEQSTGGVVPDCPAIYEDISLDNDQLTGGSVLKSTNRPAIYEDISLDNDTPPQKSNSASEHNPSSFSNVLHCEPHIMPCTTSSFKTETSSSASVNTNITSLFEPCTKPTGITSLLVSSTGSFDSIAAASPAEVGGIGISSGHNNLLLPAAGVNPISEHDNRVEGTGRESDDKVGEGESCPSGELHGVSDGVTKVMDAVVIGRKREHSDDTELMDHSGLKTQSTPKKKILKRIGAQLCLSPPPKKKLMNLDLAKIADELARCMHETKRLLVRDVVRVAGVEKSIQLFNETADIQRSGGIQSADGDKTKTPGGVFFALVKKNVSSEQKAAIFKIDRLQRERRKREEKQKRKEKEAALNLELAKKRAEWTLEIARRDLEAKASQLSRKKTADVGKRLGPRRADIKSNRHGFHGGCVNDAEVMEVESYDSLLQEMQSRHKIRREKDADLLEVERQADDFELAKECEFDFEFDI